MAVAEGSITITSAGVQQPFTTGALGFTPVTLFVTLENAQIRFWYGGTVPTTTTGHPGYVNQAFTFTKTSHIENLQMIAEGSDAKINYTVEDS